jgi:hypothetical protein
MCTVVVCRDNFNGFKHKYFSLVFHSPAEDIYCLVASIGRDYRAAVVAVFSEYFSFKKIHDIFVGVTSHARNIQISI